MAPIQRVRRCLELAQHGPLQCAFGAFFVSDQTHEGAFQIECAPIGAVRRLKAWDTAS